MKKIAKVRVTGNYVSRTSYTNRIDIILNLPVDFTKNDIVNKIEECRFADDYRFDEITVLCVYEED